MSDDDWFDDDDAADPAGTPDAKAEIQRLASLDRITYERERSAAAKALGLRAPVLDAEVKKVRPAESASGAEPVETIDPWPDPVDGLALFEDIRQRLRAYVVFASATDADALALWVAGTYLMDTWRLFPKVLVSSPTKRCGKTTLLEVLEAFAFRAMMCSNISTAAMFRSIEKWHPTVLIDEADRFLRDNPELNGIINSGHTRRGAFVNRCVEVNGEQDVRRFSVWGAQVIAGIGSQEDTLVDRSIVVGLRRKLPTDQVTRLPFDLHDQMLPLRRQLARWADDNSIRIAHIDAEPPPCGNDRMRDNYGPVWRLAVALGGSWPDRVATAYTQAAGSGDDADEPAGVMLLRDLESIFTARAAERLPSAVLVVDLVAMEDRPWSEWRHGKPLTVQSIARLLRPFDVRPRDAKYHNQEVQKSYFRADITAAFTRYAVKPGSDPLPRYHADTKGKNGSAARYQNGGGSGPEAGISEEKQSGSGVADRNPEDGACDHCGAPDPDIDATDGTSHARIHRGCFDGWFAALDPGAAA